MGLSRNVFFVGFMGAGKSTVARRIARTYGIASLDMDKYIERSCGKSIPEIFEEGGEEMFRRIEADTLRELASKDGSMLISCGGGIVQSAENRRLLKQAGVVVHLLVDADEAAERISDKSSRPLFKDMPSARKLCSDRLPLYEEVADITVTTGGKGVREISREVCRRLSKEGIICQRPE